MPLGDPAEIPWTYRDGIIRCNCGTCGGPMGQGHACWVPLANDIRRIVREELQALLAELRADTSAAASQEK